MLLTVVAVLSELQNVLNHTLWDGAEAALLSWMTKLSAVWFLVGLTTIYQILFGMFQYLCTSNLSKQK